MIGDGYIQAVDERDTESEKIVIQGLNVYRRTNGVLRYIGYVEDRNAYEILTGKSPRFLGKVLNMD